MNDHWQYPPVLFALWLVPFLALLVVRSYLKRRSAIRRFLDPTMSQRLAPQLGSVRSGVKSGLFILGVSLLIVAAAGPRFGAEYERVVQRGVDLFVLLDVSRSMMAEDVAPNRLERAKSDIRDLLAQLKGDRIGLAVFAGRTVIKVPLTTDHEFFKTALDQVDTDSGLRGGSLIGDAIRKTLDAMEQRPGRDQVIVLITDGDDHQSYALEAAQQAVSRAVKIFTVGLGDTADGARIPIRDSSGISYVKHEGEEIWSKMNGELLEQIALTTNAAYIPASTRAYDLGKIYVDHIAKLKAGDIQQERRQRTKKRFQLFLGLGLGVLMLELLIPAFGRNQQAPATQQP